MRRKYSYTLMVLIIIFLLAACNSKDNDGETTEPTTDEAIVLETTEEVAQESDEPKIEMIKDIGPEVVEDIIFSEDFEGESTKLTGRGNSAIEITDKEAYEGTKSLEISGRKEYLDSVDFDIMDIISVNKYFKASAWVKYTEGEDEQEICYMFEGNRTGALVAGSVIAKKGEWTYLEGEFNIPAEIDFANLYLEMGWSSEDTGDGYTNVYIDNINIVEKTILPANVPSIKEVYEDYFDIGVAIVGTDIQLPERTALILKHFNTITPGNELKPDSMLDYDKCISSEEYDTNPAVKFRAAIPLLEFAKENGLKVRGHTLVWHSQTPRWFFAEEYSKDEDAPLVSKEKMLLRLENYIKNIFEYINENYPGLFYAWDVVNEAINNDGAPNGIRSDDSLWYQVIGEEFIEKAFEFARKYAEPDVKLFYNDYNEYELLRRITIYELAQRLQEKGIIDGIGMQSHISTGTPTIFDYEDTILKFASLGLEVQITELDMHNTSNSEEDLFKQGQRYQRLLNLVKDLKKSGKANITNLTFWGIDDNNTWLTRLHSTITYPLLFDKDLKPKPAYWGVVGALE